MEKKTKKIPKNRGRRRQDPHIVVIKYLLKVGFNQPIDDIEAHTPTPNQKSYNICKFPKSSPVSFPKLVTYHLP
ncbi:MAG TPA: hypothetical protein VMY59_05255 [Candidatus Thermoplasmatota archaeon]|nr:hypothetical protein [Candidatus Thermoplasmatota archaeon]